MLEEGRGKVRKESAWLGPAAAVEEKEEAKGRAERERERMREKERREVVDLPLYTLL